MRELWGLCSLGRWMRVPSFVTCGVLLLLATSLHPAHNYKHSPARSGMSSRHFQGLRNIMEVDCSAYGITNSDILTMSLYDSRSGQVIASANLKSEECTTSASFSLCSIKGTQMPRVTTLVLDLQQNESKLFGCNVTVTRRGLTEIISWSMPVKASVITVSTIAMLTSPVPEDQPVQKDSSTPMVSGSIHTETALFDVHPAILISCLLFLVFFIVLSVILIVLHIKERRRRHYLAEEYDTPLPVKSEYAVPGAGARGIGGEKERILAAGGRSPRPSTSSPLPHHVRKVSGTGSGGGGSMRYQQTGAFGASAMHDELPGYAGSHSISVYYAEPWSGVDNDSKDKMRPVTRGPPSQYGEPQIHYKGTPLHHAVLPGHHKCAILHHVDSPYKGSPVHFGDSPSHHPQIHHDIKGVPVTSSAPPADDNP